MIQTAKNARRQWANEDHGWSWKEHHNDGAQAQTDSQRRSMARVGGWFHVLEETR